MGVRFQTVPNATPGNIVLHVRLKDDTNAEQMEVLGILGVNLIHAAFCHWRKPEQILVHLMDGIRPGRVEVDMIDFRGSMFSNVDNRLMSLKMVHLQLTPVALFQHRGRTLRRRIVSMANRFSFAWTLSTDYQFSSHDDEQSIRPFSKGSCECGERGCRG